MNATDLFPKDLFAGKTVFVTGGGSGINLGIAKNFAALGAKLGICGRSQERLDGAAVELRTAAVQLSAISLTTRRSTMRRCVAAPSLRSTSSPNWERRSPMT